MDDRRSGVALDRLKPGGANAAADFFERRPTPSARSSSSGRDGIDVVGAERQRHLRELRSIQSPIHLNGVDVVGEDPRQSNALHIFVSGRRLRVRLFFGQRGKRANRLKPGLQSGHVAADGGPFACLASR